MVKRPEPHVTAEADVRADELQLAWEDETDRGRHRHRGVRLPGGRRDGRRRGRSLLALLITVFILGLISGGVYWGFDKVRDFFVAPDYNSGGTGEVVVEVTKDQTATQIAQVLYDKGVIKSAKAFIEAAKASERSKEIQPGFYKLRLKMRASDALSMMLERSSRVVNKAVIPEGHTYLETFKILSEATKIPVADFQAAAKDPIALGIPDWWFNRSDKKQSIISVEGFLWPDTYEFNPTFNATQILKQIVAQFMKTAESIDLVKTAESKNVSPFAALISASLVQAEAGVKTDMGKIARVIYNRLDKSMNLEYDSTTNYWRELNGQPRKFGLTTPEQTDPTNPYRTYGMAGLPPGPIGNPGKDALLAALNPEPGPWLYFVRIDKAGNSAFTDNYAQHQRNIALAKQNGV
jgi:UPF0755 protein